MNLHRPNIPPASLPLPAGVPPTVPRRSLPLVRAREQSAFVFFRGPSRLNGAPIIGVVTGAHSNPTHGRHRHNTKLGPMAQLHILHAEVAPNIAKRTGLDVAVCGDCTLRTASGDLRCYVNTAFATTTLWKAHAWRPQQLKLAAEALRTHHMPLRVGSYGDPAALPERVIAALVAAAPGHTGYTHDWRHPRSAWLKPYCMASIESEHDLDRAVREGWRTYRIVVPHGHRRVLVLDHHEVLCPSETHGKTCDDCRLCNGSRGPDDARKLVAIPAHGWRGRGGR
jgi:hypothetical protein